MLPRVQTEAPARGERPIGESNRIPFDRRRRQAGLGPPCPTTQDESLSVARISKVISTRPRTAGSNLSHPTTPQSALFSDNCRHRVISLWNYTLGIPITAILGSRSSASRLCQPRWTIRSDPSRSRRRSCTSPKQLRRLDPALEGLYREGIALSKRNAAPGRRTSSSAFGAEN